MGQCYEWHVDRERSYFLGPIINRKCWGYVGVEVISVSDQFVDYLSPVWLVIRFIVVESTEKDLELAFEVYIYIYIYGICYVYNSLFKLILSSRYVII